MTFDFRYPQLTGATEREQLQQLKTYIHQLVDQLKWALNSTEPAQSSYVIVREKVNSGGGGGISTIGLDDDSTQARFNELKPLIIKSAEIIEAYYEAINRRLEGLYVAQSDFGVFAEKTSQQIEETSTNTTQQFQNIQVVVTDIGDNVGSLADEILNISEEFNYTQRDVVDIQSNIQTINGEVVSLSGEVVALDGEIKSVEENVGAIDSELKTVGSNVETLDTELQDTKVGISSTIESISEEVGVIDKDLQGVKAGVESGIKDLSDEVGKVDSKIEDAKSAIGSDVDKLKKSLDALNQTLIDVNAHIKSGLLYYDENEIPVYGLEVGQKNTVNGVEVFNKFARFCAGRLSFYDNNGTEVAYISDYKLYITHAEVTGTLKLGGYLVDTSRGVTFKWVGRS